MIFNAKFSCGSFRCEFVTEENSGDWEQVIEKQTYQPVRYTSNYLFYHAEYLASTNSKTRNLSCILYFEKKPVAIWPLFLVRKNDNWFTEINEPIFSPLISSAQQKRINGDILSIISLICHQIKSDQVIVRGPYLNARSDSNWSQFLWSREWKAEVKQELLIDLSSSIDNINKRIRKSYKNLIKQYDRKLFVDVFRNWVDQDVWTEFRLLHEKEARKATRSVKSWDLQRAAVCANKAFYIRVRNHDLETVGGSYFPFTKHEVVYGVAAYDRSLTGVPIGHVSLARAISEGIALGCDWLHLGTSSQDRLNQWSRKELNIVNFKNGFATNSALVCDFTKNVTSESVELKAASSDENT